MLDRYFAPYAEYTLRTKLAEAELRAALKQECGFSFAHWKKLFGAAWSGADEIPFLIRKNRRDLVLYPGCRGRNSARGELHLTAEKDPYSADTILHIVIRPPEMRWFCWLWLGFLSVWTIAVLLARQWMLLAAVPVMLGGFFLVLQLCRSAGEQEIPQIRRSFEALIRKLEKRAV